MKKEQRKHINPYAGEQITELLLHICEKEG